MSDKQLSVCLRVGAGDMNLLTINSEVVREMIINSEAEEMQLASFFSVMTSFLL